MAPQDEFLQLTAAQLGVWAGQQLAPQSPDYNCGSFFEIHGAVDVGLMREAVRVALEDAETLRARVSESGQTLVPVSADVGGLEVLDLSDADDAPATARAWMQRDQRLPADPAEASAVRHALLVESPECSLLYLRYHHALMDGFGQTLHTRRIAEVYSALVAGEEIPHPRGVALREVVKEESEYPGSAAHRRDSAYWLSRLSQPPEPVSLGSAGRGHQGGATGSVLRHSTDLTPQDVSELKQLAEALGVRPAAVLVAAVAAYQCQLTGREEGVLNLPVPARASRAALTTPAMLANELPLRLEVPTGISFGQLAGHTSERLAELVRHQRLRGEELHRELGLSGTGERLAGTTVNVVTFDQSLSFAGLPSTAHHLSSGPVHDLQFDIFIEDGESPRARLVVDANARRHPADAPARHARGLLSLLRAALRSPDEEAGRLPLLNAGERRAVLQAAAGPERPWDLERCLHDLIAEQAALTPESVAVRHGGTTVPYRELLEQAGRLAAYLCEKGVGPGSVVGVHEVRSPQLAVELLAVLTAGAAYLPLDPELPAARLGFQVEDSNARLVLSSSDLVRPAEALGVEVVAVDKVLPGLPEPDGALAEAGRPTAEDPAYVIYTSGSTGRPKGVAVPHRGIVNRLRWMQEEFHLTERDRVLQKTPFTFDVSVWELFWPLLAGAQLHFADPGEHRDPRAVARRVREYGVTVLHFVPSMFDLFLAEPEARGLSSLRHVLCSGEALRPETVQRFFTVHGEEGAPELHNLYGPTEASVDVTHRVCTAEDGHGPVPIGRPMANTRAYVLSRYGEPLPFGVPGELYLGGPQVALGYVNRPELTAERFVASPLRDGPLYRTGDVAVLEDDGLLYYRGRLDDQVKIRGFRVEPAEVETALHELPGVREAAVTVRDSAEGQHRLIGHLLPDGGKLDEEELLRLLRQQLPEHMVPARLVSAATLPVTANGKLDRAALASALPEGGAERGEARGPETEGERLLHGVWCRVLGVERVDVRDSFFSLGGDSMLAIRVRAAVEAGGHTFSVAELFRSPTIRELAAVLRPFAPDGEGPAAGRGPFALLPDADRGRLPDGVEDAYPLSAMQAGMLFHADYSADSSVYRVVTSVRVEASLDLEALRKAATDTATRHPSLRCSFELSRYSRPLQLVHRRVEVPVAEGEDLGALEEADQRHALEHWVEQAKFTRFEPAAPPLFRFTAHRLGPSSFQLSVVEHHVVLDGWSDVRMLEEVTDRYLAHLTGAELHLPQPVSTYRDFVAAEQAALANTASRRHWAETLEGAEPTRLPRRRTFAAQDGLEETARHRRHDVPVPPAVAERLRDVARSAELPLKSLLGAVHLGVQALVSGRDEVLTGMVANTRLEEPGGDEVVGVFLNTLPLRSDVTSASWLEAARHVFEQERLAAPHRRYPFAQMQRDAGGELRLDAYVNFMDFHRDRRSVSGVVMSGGTGVAETDYPLAVNFLIDPVGGGLRLWLDCDESVLEPRLCARLTGYYRQALESVARDPDGGVREATLLGAEERAQLSRWGAGTAAEAAEATVHELFARQARRTPLSPALAHRFVELSYGELAERSTRLARRLREAGVGPGHLVGVRVARGVDLVVALLGVLEAGAAYVPMDPSFPRSRLEYIAADAAISCLVSDGDDGSDSDDGTEGVPGPHRMNVRQETDEPRVPREDAPGAGPEDLAYVIYTSGSTGEPKGTAVRHRNVVNFFAGMDEKVGCGPDDVQLALTSVSFDISVLELLWPLTRGAKVVIAGERPAENLVRQPEAPEAASTFSLFFFAADAGGSAQDGYRLVLDAARFADRNGFEAVWTPERHFHPFGGLYPNPSVMASALATATERIALRAGSVVAPLHNTVRIAEDWSVVDNLSGGRVGLAFAPGWNSNDFALAPQNYAERKQVMGEQLADFRALWSGEPVLRSGGSGEDVQVRIFPPPVQEQPPIWLTSVGSPETFRRAGSKGVNVLTHLLGQSPAELTEKIAAYREARREAGHEGRGHVTLMAHAFMARETEDARSRARGAFREYLRSSTMLWQTLFTTTGRQFPAEGAEEQLDTVIEQAIDRYFETSGLFGSPEDCAPLMRSLASAGADEVACLVDFGLPTDEVLGSLHWVNKLRRRHEEETAEVQHSLSELCERHGVTLVQGTPSLLSAMAAEPAALAALSTARAVLVGGETFPSGLARRLLDSLPDTRLLNMYGPTETTIWSTVHELDRDADAGADLVPVGEPIANTDLLVVDAHARQVPVSVPGELWIGGAGVAGGYRDRPELTRERFVPGPHLADGDGDGDGSTRPGHFYRTGDRVRWREDGRLEFLGRVDRQVKIRGHRVEPDEVESVLSLHPDAGAVAVAATPSTEGTELVAYVSPATAGVGSTAQQEHIRGWGEVWDEAYTPTATDSADSASETAPEFAGWLSSYTDAPIPEAEMREWLDHTVRRVTALAPRRVADVGVGVGLVLRSLADRVEEYHGVDVSAAALRSASECLRGRQLPSHVRLERSGPEYLAELAPESLDTVVLNSVVQYFPSAEYLRQVLDDAIRVLRPGGAVFVGDVRSLEALEMFHTSVQVARSPVLTAAAELRQTVARLVRDERELCLSPAFFRQLAADVPGVEVAVEVKRGSADNELTRFRYDVTLRVPVSGSPAAPDEVSTPQLAWSRQVADLAELRSRLAGDPAALTVRGLPNSRLIQPRTTLTGLTAAADSDTVWELERRLWGLDESAGVCPEHVAQLAEKLGRSVRLLVDEDGQLDTFDAHFGPTQEPDADSGVAADNGEAI